MPETGALFLNFRAESMPLSSHELIRALEADGWHRVGRTGHHLLFKHKTKPGTITVPHPAKDLPAGMVKSIEKASGIKL